MPAPVLVTIDVPQSRDDVYAFLDVMANHEPFNDHLMRQWEYSGPASGVGSRARVAVKTFGVADTIDIEVVHAEAPVRIVERNVAAKAGRIGEGTYTLDDLAGGGTHVTFEYRWVHAPLLDRLSAPLVRAYLRRNNRIAMKRLADLLTETARPSGPRS